MKRGLLVVGALFVVIGVLLLSLDLVRAGPVEDISAFIDGSVAALNPITKLLIGNSPGGEFLFVKALFLIIIFSVVWASLSQIEFFNRSTWILVVVSVVVAILATRFLDSQGTINAILLPYSTIGIAISAGLPFIIYFLIVSKGFSDPGHKLIRRLAWLFFAVIFLILWFTRYEDVDTVGRLIYPLTAGAAIIMMILDGTINKLFTQLKIEKAGVQNKEELITSIHRKLTQVDKDFADGIINAAEKNRRVGRYRKQIAALNK